MKKLIVIAIALFLTSCIKFEYKPVGNIYLKVVKTQHADEKTEVTYHYGYSFTGKLGWHWGDETTPEKNIVYFQKDTLKVDINSKEVYNKVKEGDSLEFDLKLIYRNSKYVGYNLNIKK